MKCPMVTAGVLALVLCAAASARAESSRQDEAKKFYRLGSKQYDAGEYRRALKNFNRAYDAAPMAGFLFNIGQCHKHLKHYREAAQAFEGFLARDPPADQAKLARKLLKEMRKHFKDESPETEPPPETPESAPPPPPPEKVPTPEASAPPSAPLAEHEGESASTDPGAEEEPRSNDPSGEEAIDDAPEPVDASLELVPIGPRRARRPRRRGARARIKPATTARVETQTAEMEEQEATAVAAAGASPPPQIRETRPHRRRRWVLGILGAAAVVAGAVVLGITLGQDDGPPPGIPQSTLGTVDLR